MQLKMCYNPETYFSEIEMQVSHNPLFEMTISDSNLASLSLFVFPLLEISIMFSSKWWLKSYLGSLQRIFRPWTSLWFCLMCLMICRRCSTYHVWYVFMKIVTTEICKRYLKTYIVCALTHRCLTIINDCTFRHIFGRCGKESLMNKLFFHKIILSLYLCPPTELTTIITSFS